MPDSINKVALIVQPFQQIWLGPEKIYGGVERSVANLIQGLSERDITVTLFTGKESNLPCEVVKPAGSFHEEFGIHHLTSTQLAEYAGSIRAEIQRREQKGYGFDIINNHYDPIAFVALQGITTPTLTTLRGPGTEENRRAFGTFPQSAFSALSTAQIASYGGEVKFIGFVYNSVRDNGLYSDEKRDYFFSVGRIQPGKGQHKAIEIAKLAGIDLIIAGNSVDHEYFARQVQPHITHDLSVEGKARSAFIKAAGGYDSSGDKITYVGEVNELERDTLMRHAKAFLFPILAEEAFGNVLAEAGVVGTPVLAYKRSSVPEVVAHGISGYYGESTQELVELSSRLDQIRPSDCRAHVLQKFNIDRMIDGYLNLYDKLLHRS